VTQTIHVIRKIIIVVIVIYEVGHGDGTIVGICPARHDGRVVR